MPRNFIVYKKESDQTFVFDFDDSPVGPLFLQLGKFAADPQIDFNWRDATIVRKKIFDLSRPNLQNL